MAIVPSLLVFVAHIFAGEAAPFQVGSPQFCQIDKSNLITYEVLPGLGWDNLVNEVRGNVYSHNYTKCKTTDDGIYLIPDYVYATPLKTSKVQFSSEVIDHYQKYKDDLSASINIGGSGIIDDMVGISGKMSLEFQLSKSKQINENTILTRVKASYAKYTATMQQGFQNLDSDFRDRVLSIANHLENDRYASAKYESQMLVRDFGTHVLTKLDSGAAVVKKDYLSSDDEDSNLDIRLSISKSASASFFGLAGININAQLANRFSYSDKYAKRSVSSEIVTYGGPTYLPSNFSLDEWAANINNNLVAVDKSGDPLHYLINSRYFPEIPRSNLFNISKNIQNAVRSYYKFNAFRGCTDRNAKNFNARANIDDNSCQTPDTNLTFGGVFQKCLGDKDICTSHGLESKNILTGDFSCPDGYQTNLLLTNTYSESRSRKECHRRFLFFKTCHDVPHLVSSTYEAYWCSASRSIPENSGLIFGGTYTSHVPNTLSGSQTCPHDFQSQKIALDWYICLSQNYEMETTPNIASFGGFFSCQNGNPLANQGNQGSNLPKKCPPKYSVVMGTDDNECEVNYCLLAKTIKEFNPMAAHKPPFMKEPKDYNEQSTYSISSDGLLWSQLIPINSSSVELPFSQAMTLKHAQETFKKLLTSDSREMNLSSSVTKSTDILSSIPRMVGIGGSFTEELKMDSSSQISNGLSKSAIAGVSIVATTCVCLLITSLIIIKMRRKNRVHYRKDENQSLLTNSNVEHYS